MKKSKFTESQIAFALKHLAASQEASYTLEQALAGIHRLRTLHVEMDLSPSPKIVPLASGVCG